MVSRADVATAGPEHGALGEEGSVGMFLKEWTCSESGRDEDIGNRLSGNRRQGHEKTKVSGHHK